MPAEVLSPPPATEQISSGGPKTSLSLRKNGKNWHEKRQAFRPTAALTPYAKRKVAQDSLAATKAREKEMKAEKKEAKDELVRRIKEKREKKAERERYEKMEEKMHKKRVERVKRREKRNKMLKS